VAFNRLQNGHCAHSMRAETKDRVLPYLTSTGNIHTGRLKLFTTLCMTKNHESNMNINTGAISKL
jgi:hypothetical protein